MVAYTEKVTLKGKTICVLDDHRPSLDLVEALLSPTEAKLALFTNPQSGLDFLQNNSPDLVILDIMMPNIDGWEIYNQMRLDRFNNETPVIFLSCLFQSDDESLLNRTGQNCRILSKPIKAEKLIDTIQNMIF